jgi:PEGA domain-containing protein
MNVRNVRAAAIAASALLVSGCASIIRGSGPESVSIRSSPGDANVKIYDANTGMQISSGKTPVLVSLAKSRGFFQGGKYRVVIEKPGFEKREVIIDSHVSGWYIAGNIVFGGLIGWLIVDPATGAMWTLDEQVMVDLEAIAPPPPPQAQAERPVARFMTMDELREQHPELEARLVPVAL